MIKHFYTEQEMQTLNELYEIAKKYTTITLPDVPIEAAKTFAAIGKIEEESQKRGIEHYSTRLDELVEDIKDEVEFNVVALSVNYPNYKKPMLIVPLIPYLDLLKEKSPELHQKAKRIIDDTFSNREKIMNTSYAKLILKKLNEDIHPTKPLSLTFNGKAITALGVARGRGKTDRMQPQATQIDGVNLFLPDSVQKIGVGTAKIYRYAVTEFTKRNSNKITKERIDPRLLLDIRDFADANDVDIHSTDAMKNFRRKLRKSLETLRCSGVTWTEKVKGKPQSYAGMNYIGKYELTNNTLMIEFTLSMAEYLVQLPLIQYPRSLYKLDDRDYNAFAIGEAMCIRYSQNNNVIRQMENKLSVETLLKYTSFPSYEELKKNRWKWEDRVQGRLESVFDRLQKCGFLKEYGYHYSDGTPVPDEDVYNRKIDSYGKYISLMLWYELNDYDDHQTRVSEIEKKKAESKKKLQARRKKTGCNLEAQGCNLEAQRLV